MNKKAKILSVILVAAILISTFPIISFAADRITETTRIASGRTYEISSYKDLETLSILVNEKAYTCSGATFELTSDIEVNSNGSGTNVLFMAFPDFRGTFNGNGHTISGLYIKGAGMFEVLNGATINALTLKDAYIDMEDSTSCPVGGIAGAISHSALTSCTFSGTVINGGDYTGGIVGKAKDGSAITGCKNRGMIFGEDYVSGIAGMSDNSSTVKRCINYGATYGTGENQKGIFNAYKQEPYYQQGSCGRDASYKLYGETGLLIISGNGVTGNYLADVVESPFEENENIKYVIVEDGITEIGDFLFAGCSNLQYVSLPESVTRIGSGAFMSCTSLKEFKISGNVTSIGIMSNTWLSIVRVLKIDMDISPFCDCEQMMSFDIDKDNPNYSIGEYGELYNKDKTELIGYPTGNVSRAFVIPDTVEEIKMFAICENTNLEEIYIPKSVKTLNGCSIGDCPNLSDVYYDSYQENWNALCSGIGSLGVPPVMLPDTTVVHCTECNHESIAEDFVVQPTCIYDGYTVCHCVTCGHRIHTNNIPALGHNYIYDEALTACTVHDEGEIVEKCTRCGTERAVSKKIETDCEFGNEYVSGFNAGTTEKEICKTLMTAGCTSVEVTAAQDDYVGTCSNITLEYADGSVENYEVVIFGDVNGDGWYDGQDAMIVSCLANGMLNREDVGDAAYTAADCNHDGVIDNADTQLLNEAGVLLSDVDQTKDSEILLETSSVYVEYVNLIDQDVIIEDEEIAEQAQPDEPAADETAEDKPVEKLNLFKIFFNFIVNIWKFVVSILNF